MRHKYAVIAEYKFKDSLVLTLDGLRRDDDFLSQHIIIDGDKIPYQLTHSEELIIVKADRSYLGKVITFC